MHSRNLLARPRACRVEEERAVSKRSVPSRRGGALERRSAAPDHLLSRRCSRSWVRPSPVNPAARWQRATGSAAAAATPRSRQHPPSTERRRSIPFSLRIQRVPPPTPSLQPPFMPITHTFPQHCRQLATAAVVVPPTCRSHWQQPPFKGTRHAMANALCAHASCGSSSVRCTAHARAALPSPAGCLHLDRSQSPRDVLCACPTLTGDGALWSCWRG